MEFTITGKNKQGERGSWVINTENEKELNQELKTRGIEADSINGESVKKVKPITPKEN